MWVIDSSGQGFEASFIGTLTDFATGLIYIGNGQYYDPETGRFLTRNVFPNSTNPYVPWNPIGLLFAPLTLLSIYYSRKKAKASPWIALIFLALFVTACSLCPPASGNSGPTPSPDTSTGGTPTGGAETTPTPTPEPPPSPSPTPTPDPCPGCTPMGKFIMSAYYIPTEKQYGEDSALWPIYAVVHGDPGCKVALSKSHGYDCEANYDNLRLARHDFLYDRNVVVGQLPRDGAGVCVQGTGKLNSGEYISCVASPYVLDDDVRFDWQLEDKVNRLENSVISFETVAVCFSDTEKSVLLPFGTEIVIPELGDYMKANHNSDATFTVRDTGEGLCKGISGEAYETIDIFSRSRKSKTGLMLEHISDTPETFNGMSEQES